jgi:hypothetical protein
VRVGYGRGFLVVHRQPYRRPKNLPKGITVPRFTAAVGTESGGAQQTVWATADSHGKSTRMGSLDFQHTLIYAAAQNVVRWDAGWLEGLSADSLLRIRVIEA